MNRKKETQGIKQNIAKFVIAVALVVATITSSGVVAEQVGLDITPSVYAGPCTSSGGGGCGLFQLCTIPVTMRAPTKIFLKKTAD